MSTDTRRLAHAGAYYYGTILLQVVLGYWYL